MKTKKISKTHSKSEIDFGLIFSDDVISKPFDDLTPEEERYLFHLAAKKIK